MGWIGGAIALAAVVIVGVALFAGRSDEATRSPNRVSATRSQQSGSAWPAIDVYKDPSCGCCSKWVEHLQQHDFTVRVTDTNDLGAVKAAHGVPPQVESCHTALVGGYVVEGHVPAADIVRLLQERPAIAGIGVAGMPIGSPGMEVPGTKAQPYEVVAFDKDARTHVFARHDH
jgi:hypothetical protein